MQLNLELPYLNKRNSEQTDATETKKFLGVGENKIVWYSRIKTKKKDLHLESVSDFSVFVPNSGCSLKKKKKDLQPTANMRVSCPFHVILKFFSKTPKFPTIY